MPSFVSPVSRTLVAGQGLAIAFDAATLSGWPDAFLPANLPPSPPSAVELTLTAHRPLTTAHSTRLQVIDAATGTTEIPGTWSGPAGSLDTQPGIDYWQLDNWDTSTGVYGWSSPYGTGSAGRHLDIASHTDQWYGTSDFDVSFRLERSNWLALGDASYNRIVALGPRFGIWLSPTPASSATNYVTFRVTGMGEVRASQTALGATNNVPIWVRCARSGGTLTISRSPDGTAWTTTATASPGGSVTDPGSYGLGFGGSGGSFFNTRYSVDGILSDARYRVAGTLVADIAIADAPNTSATSWTSSATGKTVTRLGGTLLGGATGTITPRFTFATPPTLSDIVLDMPGLRSGEITVDEILIEAECAGGIYRDGAVHLS